MDEFLRKGAGSLATALWGTLKCDVEISIGMQSSNDHYVRQGQIDTHSRLVAHFFVDYLVKLTCERLQVPKMPFAIEGF
jgi:hypothetical protein